MIEIVDGYEMKPASKLAVLDENGAVMVSFELPDNADVAVPFSECKVVVGAALITEKPVEVDIPLTDEAYALAILSVFIRHFQDVVIRCQIGHAHLQATFDSMEKYDG